ncbi:4-amino-4-deoxy-L-arabinose-phosphoundecaprenol flippase subunit ArnE [Pigmentiphaga humi]|uniref:4-amino-4-deoxy-L-arabinose-phosphoundecaprenol flippase subunit ArnE n=1 Tax=Pigmentiphaga humi TaxID=2478468 RepID=A0A3P4B0Y8_9BURK|nr:EamA family transporter [Pigmentiphaga humi]VCU69308.1 4-amino-4-deoxy-L-arabinose-phosphoundecaprenol flippase subunit ArnE [Pigmentiphaga humi]
MTPLVALLWTLNVLVDTGGQLAFKAAASHPAGGSGLQYWRQLAARPWIWIGIGCYILEFVVWLAFLSLVPLSEGVLLGSINIVAIMIAGRFLFNERLTPLRVAGIALIAAGVAVVGIP